MTPQQWELRNDEGMFKQDPLDGRGVGAWTVTNKDDKDLLGGLCWKAAVDTPGRTAWDTPLPRDGEWRVIGWVKWNNDNLCRQVWNVTIKEGKVSALKTVGKEMGKTR